MIEDKVPCSGEETMRPFGFKGKRILLFCNSDGYSDARHEWIRGNQENPWTVRSGAGTDSNRCDDRKRLR